MSAGRSPAGQVGFPLREAFPIMISGGHALGLRSRGRLRLTQSRLCSRIPFSPVLHNRHQQVLMSHPPLKSQRGKHQICQSHPQRRGTSASHRKMKKIKAARDRLMADKTEEKGLIMVHTGKGKGNHPLGLG